MDPLRQYKIAFVGLKSGINQFNYHIDNRFFENFTGSLVEQAELDVKIKFDKRLSFFILDFHLQGKIHLPCDRCGSELDYPIDAEYNIVVKFDEHREQDKDDSMADIIYISRNESHLDVAQLIYEFVNLSIPINHVTCDNIKDQRPCNRQVLEKLNTSIDEIPVDHRWDDLTKIKFN